MTIPKPSNPQFFQFEADFVASLRCIPMLVRYKLDSCGIKLKLQHWHQCSVAEREQLVSLPCDTAEAMQTYRDTLQAIVTHHSGSPAQDLPIDPTPPWQVQDQIPPIVQTKAEAQGLPITLEQWRSLTPLQRFALIKLSRPSHENHNFGLALQEFGCHPSQ